MARHRVGALGAVSPAIYRGVRRADGDLHGVSRLVDRGVGQFSPSGSSAHIAMEQVIPSPIPGGTAGKNAADGAIGQFLPVVAGVHGTGNASLFQIVQALGGLGFHLRLGKRRQEHASEDGDDSDYDQQFYEGEGTGTELRKARTVMEGGFHTTSSILGFTTWAKIAAHAPIATDIPTLKTK